MRSTFIYAAGAALTQKGDSLQENITVTIDKVLNNGYGLARNEAGSAVFVAGALAGETWRLTKVKRKKGTLWSIKARGLTQAPTRQKPECIHFPECGGCRLLHVKRDAEMDIKTEYLRDVLRRVGKLDQPEISSHDFAAPMSRIRGKFHVDDRGNLGFMSPESNQIALSLECFVIPKSVAVLQKNLKAWCGRTGFRGEIFFATDTSGENPVLELRGNMNNYKREPWEIEGAAGISWVDLQGRERWSVGQSRVIFNWNGADVPLRPSGFFQSNPASWPLFFQLVTAWQSRYQPAKVWDVHAGAGFLSSALVDVEGYASEPDSAAAALLQTVCEPRGFQVYQGTAEQVIELNIFPVAELDGAILDPPRSGLELPLRQWLAEQGPASLLYISCDMASFARDLNQLSGSYRIDAPIHAMNLNPGTLKLELAAMLVRIE